MAVLFSLFFLIPMRILGQEHNYQTEMLFREDWKEIPAEIPVTQKHVSNPDLILNLYGVGSDSLKKSHHGDDPYYIWSGRCLANWALTLKHRAYFADLSGHAKIIWRTKQAGFRQLRIVLKLNNGTWLVSDLSDGLSHDWRISEFKLRDITWYGEPQSYIGHRISPIFRVGRSVPYEKEPSAPRKRPFFGQAQK